MTHPLELCKSLQIFMWIFHLRDIGTNYFQSANYNCKKTFTSGLNFTFAKNISHEILQRFENFTSINFDLIEVLTKLNSNTSNGKTFIEMLEESRPYTEVNSNRWIYSEIGSENDVRGGQGVRVNKNNENLTC